MDRPCYITLAGMCVRWDHDHPERGDSAEIPDSPEPEMWDDPDFARSAYEADRYESMYFAARRDQ